MMNCVGFGKMDGKIRGGGKQNYYKNQKEFITNRFCDYNYLFYTVDFYVK